MAWMGREGSRIGGEGSGRFDREIPDHLEVSAVVREEGQAVLKAGRGNAQLQVPNRPAFPLELAALRPKDAASRPSHRENLDASQEPLNRGRPVRRSSRGIRAVEKLRHGDRAHGPPLGAQAANRLTTGGRPLRYSKSVSSK